MWVICKCHTLTWKRLEQPWILVCGTLEPTRGGSQRVTMVFKPLQTQVTRGCPWQELRGWDRTDLRPRAHGREPSTVLFPLLWPFKKGLELGSTGAVVSWKLRGSECLCALGRQGGQSDTERACTALSFCLHGLSLSHTSLCCFLSKFHWCSYFLLAFESLEKSASHLIFLICTLLKSLYSNSPIFNHPRKYFYHDLYQLFIFLKYHFNL